mgnify:CR=1 FL=1|tara:strand:- start:550 stop:1104 length:555 start_codon:yes stop_codon:yes gene_type:complete
MSLTPTKNIPLGFIAPGFKLLNPLINKFNNLDDLKGKKVTVIIFMCNHCPYVIHILDQLVQIANDYKTKDVSFIGINSNNIISHPQDSPENMVKLIKDYKIQFSYLFDETQEVAKAYDAACTPDFSVFDKNLKCVYRGQMDSSRPGNDEPINGKDLREVIDLILNNQSISKKQIPSIGCNIKWK